MQADRQMTSYRRGREPSDSASWRTIYTQCSLSPTAISANFSTSIAPTKRSGAALLKVFMPSPGLYLEGIHENDRGQVQDLIRRLIGGEPIDDLECRVVRPDGSTSWVLCRCFPVRDAQGHVCRLVGSAQDITQLKRAEQQVQARLESREVCLIPFITSC